MSKKLWVRIVASFVFSVSIVIFLLAISVNLRQRQGNFLRTFPPHPALEGDSLNIIYNSYYIAGGTPHHVYLGNYESPLHLLVVNVHSLDTQHVSLDVKGIFDQKFWSARVKVDSPYFYVTDGAVPRIFRGNVSTWYADRFPYDTISYYRDIVPITPDSYMVKTLRGLKPENVIGKISNEVPRFRYNNGILIRQIDGVFCTDGMLRYDKIQSRLVYTYYYRNDFFVLDTNLNLAYKGQTIDTISQAQIKVATIRSTDEHTMAAPPLFVNKKTSVYGGRLFVNSNMPAKNQPIRAFEEGEVIDVYNLSGGAYMFSFYIYNYSRTKRMIDFSVFGDKLIVLYDRLLRVYNLLPEYFPQTEKK